MNIRSTFSTVASLAFAVVAGCILSGCQGSTSTVVRDGVAVANVVCTLIEEHTDAGIALRVCATEQEIAQFGPRPALILEYRARLQTRVDGGGAP